MAGYHGERDKHKRQLTLGGHRGHLSGVRENTIENFEEVLKLGVTYIEIDVQLTKDKIPVLYHDFELAERTELTGIIRDFTLEELRLHFTVTTLDEAIVWCGKTGMKAALEVKIQPLTMWMDMPELIDSIIGTIQKYDFFEECFVFGIDYRAMRLVKRKDPRIHIGLIVPFVPENPAFLMKSMEAEVYISFIQGLSPDVVEQLHEAGYLVDGSVINDEVSLDKAMALSVDMMESDDPKKIIKLLEEKYAGQLSHTYPLVSPCNRRD